MHSSCAQETPLCLRILAHASKYLARSNFNKVKLLLLMENAFLVLGLGFDVVDMECRNEDSPERCLHLCSPRLPESTASCRK